MKVKIPKLVKKMFPHRLWEGSKDGKKIYLTFDDGPIPEVTPWVLEELKKHQAKATFFCIGDNISKHPEVFKDVILEGHAVGNHTFNHLNGWKTSISKYLKNVEKGQQILERFVDKIENQSEEKNVKKLLFRPPYGRIKWRQARELEKNGYQIVMWDILSMDYDSEIPSEECYRNVTDNASSGSIVVFHDSLKAEINLKVVLPEILEYYSRKGYSFEKLEE